QAISSGPGQFHLAWVSDNTADGSECLRISSTKDGGATWSAPATVASPQYFYGFMLAEAPYIGDFALAANSNAELELMWVDDRQGLGYTVQRWGVADAARGPHEDQNADAPYSPISSITDVYVATSTDGGATWATTGPIESNPAI